MVSLGALRRFARLLDCILTSQAADYSHSSFLKFSGGHNLGLVDYSFIGLGLFLYIYSCAYELVDVVLIC